MAPPALPFVAAFHAALTGLLCALLSVLVIRQRLRSRVSIGDGGDASLGRMARVFGNFAEYAALVLVLLALVEICGGAPDVNPARSVGVGQTLLAVLGASVTLLVLVARKVLA